MVLDVIIVCVLCVFGVVGLKKGLVGSLFSLLTFILSVHIAFNVVGLVLNDVISVLNIDKIGLLDKLNIDIGGILNGAGYIGKVLSSILQLDDGFGVINIGNIVIAVILFVLCYSIVRFLLKILFRYVHSKLQNMIIIGSADKICGVLIGFCGGVVVSSFICMILMFVSSVGVFDGQFIQYVNDSVLFVYFNNGIDWFISTFLSS